MGATQACAAGAWTFVRVLEYRWMCEDASVHVRVSVCVRVCVCERESSWALDVKATRGLAGQQGSQANNIAKPPKPFAFRHYL